MLQVEAVSENQLSQIASLCLRESTIDLEIFV